MHENLEEDKDVGVGISRLLERCDGLELIVGKGPVVGRLRQLPLPPEPVHSCYYCPLRGEEGEARGGGWGVRGESKWEMR